MRRVALGALLIIVGAALLIPSASGSPKRPRSW
jgi:fucose permease